MLALVSHAVFSLFNTSQLLISEPTKVAVGLSVYFINWIQSRCVSLGHQLYQPAMDAMILYMFYRMQCYKLRQVISKNERQQVVSPSVALRVRTTATYSCRSDPLGQNELLFNWRWFRSPILSNIRYLCHTQDQYLIRSGCSNTQGWVFYFNVHQYEHHEKQNFKE